MKVTDFTPEVAALLTALEHPAEPALRLAREAILLADPRIAEGVKWNAPSYHLAGAHFATFRLHGKAGLELVLHLGAKPRPDARVRSDIPDPAGLLEWKSADRAIVRLASEATARAAQEPLTAIARQWITHL